MRRTTILSRGRARDLVGEVPPRRGRPRQTRAAASSETIREHAKPHDAARGLSRTRSPSSLSGTLGTACRRAARRPAALHALLGPEVKPNSEHFQCVVRAVPIIFGTGGSYGPP